MHVDRVWSGQHQLGRRPSPPTTEAARLVRRDWRCSQAPIRLTPRSQEGRRRPGVRIALVGGHGDMLAAWVSRMGSPYASLPDVSCRTHTDQRPDASEHLLAGQLVPPEPWHQDALRRMISAGAGRGKQECPPVTVQPVACTSRGSVGLLSCVGRAGGTARSALPGLCVRQHVSRGHTCAQINRGAPYT